MSVLFFDDELFVYEKKKVHRQRDSCFCLIDDAKVSRKNIPDEFSSIGVKLRKEKRKVGTKKRTERKVTVKLP